MNHPEFLIIGSGPGGTAAARKLVAAGRRVLMIERGGYLPKEDENRDSQAVYGDKKYRTAERWLDKDGKELQPWMHYFVGGNAKLYGSAHYRFRKADFGELSYSDGLSPAWPHRYEDFDPFYDEAEKLYTVHGDRQADPTEPTDLPYPAAPIPDEEGIGRVKSGLDQIGVSHLPLPVGVQLDQENKGYQTDLTHFDAYPDPSLSKAEPEGCLLEELQQGNFELQTHTMALAFETKGRTVTGVWVDHHGGKQLLKAPNIICAAGAIQSAKLFLASAPDRSFANESGLVGCNYMAHISTTASAQFREEIPDTFAKTFGSNHFYQPDSGGELLGSVQTQGKWDAAQYGLEPWTMKDSDDPVEIAKHGLEFFFMTEDLPLKKNAIHLKSDGQIQIDREMTCLQEHSAFVKNWEEALGGIPNDILTLHRYRHQRLELDWCTHQCGTLLYGLDPEESVLDLNCRAHAYDNLWVTDGSFMPSSSALNPTLTIVANALRVSAHLAEKVA